MLLRRLTLVVLGSALLVGTLLSCTTRSNYLESHGPRFAADYTAPTVVTTVRTDERSNETLKVVSYNVRYGERIEEAIDVLAKTPELADAQVILLQEMSPLGVDRIARELGCNYVYYPACLRRSGRDFGNAVLTRGRIVADEKVVLPHLNPFNRQHRIAVRTDVELGTRGLQAYSVHTETPFLPVTSRREQIDSLLASVPDGGAPCLIAGDFNTMGRGSMRHFDEAFSRAGFQRASAGAGDTFELGPFGYAMDHVFVRGLEVVDAGKVAEADASDHMPIWVELAWTARPDAADGAAPVESSL